MKAIAFTLLILTLTNCSKQEVALLPEYINLLGTWRSTKSPSTLVTLEKKQITVQSYLNSTQVLIKRMQLEVGYSGTYIRIEVSDAKRISIILKNSLDSINFSGSGIQKIKDQNFIRQ